MCLSLAGRFGLALQMRRVYPGVWDFVYESAHCCMLYRCQLNLIDLFSIRLFDVPTQAWRWLSPSPTVHSLPDYSTRGHLTGHRAHRVSSALDCSTLVHIPQRIQFSTYIVAQTTMTVFKARCIKTLSRHDRLASQTPDANQSNAS
jgi:hypothetical protein